MRLAIYGGTFDPIHYGHLICAEEALEAYQFDEFWFLPAARPPHKLDDPNRASPEHRYEMTRLAIEGHPVFRISRSEIDRQGRSYAIDTAREFLNAYGNNATLSWIVGADSLIEFEIWRDHDALLDLCRFIAVTRPNYDLSRAPKRVLEKTELFEMTAVDLSATDIRRRVREGRSIRYRTPAAVEEYIRRNRLYMRSGAHHNARDNAGGQGGSS